jgi:hypothetical protein
MNNNNKEDDKASEVVLVIISLIVFGLIIWFLIWFTPKVEAWWSDVWRSKDYYCSSLKKIIKADPLYEDNGAFEDEAYRVTYEDGSVGLLDNATMKSGTYCVSPSRMTEKEAKEKGYVLQP